MLTKCDHLYSGKAKSLFTTEDKDYLIMLFRDDTSAFDGLRIEKLARKGQVNNQFNAFIMEKLKAGGVPTHFERVLSPTESLVKNLKMIPVECVIRNIAAGSICKRLGLTEGIDLNPSTLEFFLKNDPLHDPMINEYHIHTFGWAEDSDVVEMKRLSFKVNEILVPLFAEAGLILVDFKLEFGRCGDHIVLGDEFTPDGCRIWDKTTRDKLDKDRFRRDLGDVIESYEVAAQRLGIVLTD